MLGRARVVRLRRQFAARRQSHFIPFIFAGQLHRPQDAQHVARVVAGQGGGFVGIRDADGFHGFLGAGQQFADLHAQRIGQAPGDGDGGIGFFALDLRQHGLRNAGDARQILECQAARQAQPLQGGAHFGRRIGRNAGFHRQVACKVQKAWVISTILNFSSK
ncbi:hypothetical protein D3C72_983940 [compost metagenome]